MLRSAHFVALLLSVLFCSASRASSYVVESMEFQVPPGWKLHQDFRDNGKWVMGFEKGSDYVRLFVSNAGSEKLESMLASEAKILEKTNHRDGAFNWEEISASKEISESVGGGKKFVTLFKTELDGKNYYGYAASNSAGGAKDAAYAFLDRASVKSNRQISTRSLTGADYTGKKYYFGWGAAGSGDPSMMQNEVKYDVLHTHDIFTKEIGGNYLGTTLIGYQNAKRNAVLAAWKKIGENMTWNDMYVQYSSGHGYESGLGIDITYNEIRDNALSYPAKEIIIFTMACHSGGLVNSFNNKKSEWSHWGEIGRTLMVMASSPVSENSSTGPGTDPSEPNAPYGSAGSAFGHGLWKALIGGGDGFVDGVKDNFLSLTEIEKFTMKKTKEVGGHTPVSTGIYNPQLIMNRVPSKEFIREYDTATSHMTDAELAEKIKALDREWRM